MQLSHRSRPYRLVAALLAVAAVALGAILASLGRASALPTDLFVSEYVEGSSANKALELYNGTGAPIALDGTYDSPALRERQPDRHGDDRAHRHGRRRRRLRPRPLHRRRRELLALADQTTDELPLERERRGRAPSRTARRRRHRPDRPRPGGRVGIRRREHRRQHDAPQGRRSWRATRTGRTRSTRRSSGTGFPIDTFGGLGAHSLAPGRRRRKHPIRSPSTTRSRWTRTRARRPSRCSRTTRIRTATSSPWQASATRRTAPPRSTGGRRRRTRPDADFAGTDSFTYSVTTATAARTPRPSRSP